MKYVQEIKDESSLKAVRALVLQDLKDLHIKPPKTKKNQKTKDDSFDYGNAGGVFGTHLVLVPAVHVDYYGPVPKFLVDACKLIEKHIDTEGLFRKSGSVTRQKELKQRGENGGDYNDAHPFDVASLVKQFFRELPDPLLTSKLHDTFLKCHQVESEHARVSAILLLCHLLPMHHLSTLRFTMCFLRKVADKAEVNKMDVPNLAVCLAPNLLHTNSRNDKMNSNESKLLQIQTSIVQYLITNAECIGMVSDSLYERTTLMLSCFVSEDELEKSDTVGNESKTGKKKKKRSGSFQGIVSNLSHSFSKWRRDSKGHNQSNISDKSAMSFMSMDKSSILVGPSDVLDGNMYYEYETNPLCPDATPKLMRKRKADEEMVPFSASKKKAILQNMPQMTTLGNTPYKTPATFRKEMVFNATPRGQMSPNSTAKSKRNANGKSICCTPKTPKSNVRRKMKGLLRRLSGGKEAQGASPSGLMNSSDVGARLSSKDIADYVSIVDPPPNGQRGGSLFRRHRKTPSSPARLVTSMAGGSSEGEQHRNMTPDSSTSSLISAVSGASSTPSITNLELIARLQGDNVRVRSPATSSEISLDDREYRQQNGSVCSANRSGLRRGRPNTMKSGLPSPAKRRSLDQSSANGKEVGSCRDDVVLSTVDTSPIQKVEPMTYDQEDSPVIHLQLNSEEDSSSSEDESDEEHVLRHLAKQVSVTSVMSTAESDFDRAFIHESMLADMDEDEDGDEAEDEEHDDKSTDEQETKRDEKSDFKKPTGLPVLTSSRSVEKHETSQCSETSSLNSMSTVIFNDTADKLDIERSNLGQSKSESKLGHTKSLDSIDSGLGSEEGKLSKASSLQSVCSVDSGLGVMGRRDNHHQSDGKTLQTMQFQRTPSMRIKEPNLQISTDTQHMLSRAGFVSELDESSSQTTDEGNQSTNMSEHQTEVRGRHASPYRFPNSHMRKRGVSPVRIPTIFAKADAEAQKFRDLAPPMRPSSRGCSPRRKANLPISTGLVNAVSVQNARTKLTYNAADTSTTSIPEFESRTPPLPQDLEALKSAGSTPMYPLGTHTTLTVKDMDSENMSTPRIKPMLMSTDVTKRLLSVVPPNANETPSRKLARSPIKPVKRLQGSPKSPNPRRYSNSPKKVLNTSERLSPMPGHMAEWGV